MASNAFFRNTLPSDLEAIAAILSGAALEPVAGLSGLVTLGATGSPKGAKRVVEDIRGLSYQPRDPSTLQGIAGLLEYPMKLYERGTDYLGDQTLRATGSPGLAAIAKSSPEIFGGILGLRQVMKGSKPAIKAAESDQPDLDRRRFTRNLGLGALGSVAAAKYGLPKGLLEGPGGKTAATAAVKAVPETLSLHAIKPDGVRLATLMDAFPEVNIRKIVEDRISKPAPGDIDNPHRFNDFDLDSDIEKAIDFDDFGGDVAWINEEDFLSSYGNRVKETISDALRKMDADDIVEGLRLHDAVNDKKDFYFDIDDVTSPVQAVDADDMMGGRVNPWKGDDYEPPLGTQIMKDASEELRSSFDEGGFIYDPISGDHNVFTDVDFLEGATMEYSPYDWDPDKRQLIRKR